MNDIEQPNKLNRKQMLKEIKSIAKITQRKKVYNKRKEKIKAIVKVALVLLFIFSVNFVSSYASNFLSEFITSSNEGWAVAIIAIPVALVSVFVSVLINQYQKYYNTRFKDETLKDIYKKGRHYFDCYNLILYWLFANFLMWIIEFVNLNYVQMVIYALIMLADIIYLICFTIWKYKLLPSTLYLGNIMCVYFKIISNTELENQVYDKTKLLIDENKANETLEIIEESYDDLFEELNDLMLSIISKKDNQEEKIAYINIIKKVKSLEFKETNSLILISIYNKSIKLFDIMLKQKDYMFCKQLINELVDSWLDFISKSQDFVERLLNYLIKLIDSYDSLTIKEYQTAYREAEKFTEILGDSLKILTLFNDRFEKVIKKVEKNEILEDLIVKDFIMRVHELIDSLKDKHVKLIEIIKESKAIHFKE